jgi:hypothetical protein
LGRDVLNSSALQSRHPDPCDTRLLFRSISWFRLDANHPAESLVGRGASTERSTGEAPTPERANSTATIATPRGGSPQRHRPAGQAANFGCIINAAQLKLADAQTVPGVTYDVCGDAPAHRSLKCLESCSFWLSLLSFRSTPTQKRVEEAEGVRATARNRTRLIIVRLIISAREFFNKVAIVVTGVIAKAAGGYRAAGVRSPVAQIRRWIWARRRGGALASPHLAGEH